MALCTPCLTRHSTRWRRQWRRRVTASQVLEIARDRHVEQALNETPEKLNRDRRLVLLSDPVTMARLHYRVGRAGEILFVGELL
jgi:membrane glycosyltransferase